MKFNIPKLVEKTARTVSLSDTEKSRLLASVQMYMVSKARRVERMPQPSALYTLFHARYVAPALVIVLVFSSTGISFAAEGAIPGDVLYPVKVSINEEVVAALQQSSENRSRWEATRALRRLEEAAELSLERNLSKQDESDIAKQFEIHANKAIGDLSRIDDIDDSGALSLAQSLEVRLSAHEELLKELDEDNADLAKRVERIQHQVASFRKHAKGKFARATDASPDAGRASSFSNTEHVLEVQQSTVSTEQQKILFHSLEAIQKGSADTLKKAQQYVQDASENISADDRLRLISRLSDAETLLESGKVLVAQGFYDEALQSFSESSAISERISLFLKVIRKANRWERATSLPGFAEGVVITNLRQDNSGKDISEDNGDAADLENTRGSDHE